MRRTALLVALLLAPMAAAQTVDLGTDAPINSPVLLITQDRLYSGTLYGKAVQARTEEAVRALQAENRKIEADLEAEERDLTERRATLPPAEFRALADAFDAKADGIRAAQEAKARALSKLNDENRQRFFETALPVLAALMQEMGAVALLNKDAVVLSFDRIDITSKAIERIDSVLGDGTNPPAQP